MSIQNTVLAHVNLIDLPGHVRAADATQFDRSSSKWPDLPVRIHVLDFKAVEALDSAFYSSAERFKRQVEAKNSKVVSINFRPEILTQVIKDGKEITLGHVRNLSLSQSVKVDDSNEEAKTWMIKYSVQAARQAMDTMFNTTVAADENYREMPPSLADANFFKVATIDGFGVKRQSIFRLYFQRQTLESLTRTVLGPGGGPIDEETLLSIPCELLNIIYTSVKSRLNDERGYDLPPAIPKLLDPDRAPPTLGRGHNTSWIPMITALGAFYLQIELKA